MLPKKNITLIGGGGYLGLNIVSKLQAETDAEYSITILDLNLVPLENPDIRIDYKTIKFIKGSFCDLEKLEVALKNAEIVFHIAAVGVMGLSAGDREQIYRINIDGTRNLIKKCQEFGVKRFVYASSIAVVMIGDPIYNQSEDEPLPAPSQYPTSYGYSKAAAEKLVLAASSENFKTCALRFRAIYGPADPNATRRVVDLIKAGLFISLCTRNKHKREAITQASSINNCTKAFILAEKMLEKPDGPHGKPYNILDANITGSFDFWGPLIEALGFSRPTFHMPFWFLHLLARFYEFLCFQVFKTNPILTSFELILLTTDNTYSLRNAKQDLGYFPDDGMMTEVAEYYSKERVETCSSSAMSFFVVLFIVLLFLLTIFLV
ncbi:unnamed protein product [Caenorhabditis angaria]|uniref:3-beta hydroxysteroid dehydrogenase/isomerase domain-containing protein n=1 Tax=Caenorhabditis angaria TaxID=860376 RepID=A0A9P1NC61_9PELO|nr:unnamed protein product [Caenorhabditis angaria]